MTIGYKKIENSNINLVHASAAQFRHCVHSTPGAIFREASPHASPQTYEIKTFRGVLSTGHISRFQPPANRGTPGQIHFTTDKNYFQMAGNCDERFAAAIQKKTPNNLEIYKNWPAIVGSGQDFSSVSVISKKLKLKSMIISRISPHISTSESEISRMDI